MNELQDTKRYLTIRFVYEGDIFMTARWEWHVYEVSYDRDAFGDFLAGYVVKRKYRGEYSESSAFSTAHECVQYIRTDVNKHRSEHGHMIRQSPYNRR